MDFGIGNFHLGAIRNARGPGSESREGNNTHDPSLRILVSFGMHEEIVGSNYFWRCGGTISIDFIRRYMFY